MKTRLWKARPADPHAARTAAVAAERDLRERALAALERLGGLRKRIAEDGTVLGPRSDGAPCDPYWRQRLAGLPHAEAIRIASDDPDPLSVMVRAGRVYIIAGNHRIQALYEMGVPCVPVHMRLEHTPVHGLCDVPLAVGPAT
jgi:hypothetical protein